MSNAPTEPLAAPQDAQTFSALQSKLDRMKERQRELAKRILPVRKRLQKHMQERGLERLQCVNYVLTMELDDSDSDDGTEGGAAEAVFTKDRIVNFLTPEQLQEYEAANKRPKKKRKRAKLRCERDIIDIAESDGEVSE